MRRLGGIRIGLWLSGLGALGLGGCFGSSPPRATAPPLQGARVVVAAVGDPALLPALTAQRGEWEASRGASCAIAETPVEPSATGGAHVLVFPGDRLGDLMDAGALAVLPESLVQPPAPPESDGMPPAAGEAAPSSADALQFTDVIPAFRDQVSKYGGDRVALPYGGSALVLVCNRAAFDRDANRAAAEQAGVALDPPTTWEQLDALIQFFHGRDWDGDGSKDHGIALALGPDAEGVGDAVVLARAAGLGQHRDHYSLLFDSDTMDPRVATPPFVEALQKVVAWKGFGPPGVATFDAEAARKAFRQGDVALLIDRAERAARWGGGAGGGGGGAKVIGAAALPGSGRVYEPARKVWETVARPNRPSYLPSGGGWLVAVAADARGRERDAAIDFAKYLVGPETSNRVRSDPSFPMLPVRGSQVSQGLPDPRSAPGVEPGPWSEAVSRTLLAPRVVPGLRIPQARGYLDDFGKGRVAAVQGEPAEKALQGVAEAWARRTKALGADRQLWHYRRTLNSLVTTPQPPNGR